MTTPPRAGLTEISPAELKAMMDAGRARVIDVREPDEFRREHLPGAENMPLSAFDPAAVPTDDDRTVVLHCQAGVRSAKAGHLLLTSGRAGAVHLKDGLNAWKADRLPTVSGGA